MNHISPQLLGHDSPLPPSLLLFHGTVTQPVTQAISEDFLTITIQHYLIKIKSPQFLRNSHTFLPNLILCPLPQNPVDALIS